MPMIVQTSLGCTCVGLGRAPFTYGLDLLAFNGRDLRLQPLMKRQACL